MVLVQFAPVLVGRVYRFEDIAGYFEPLWTAAARAMAAGRWPIWDGGAWSGQPITGDPQAGVFYPLNWLWLLLPVLRAYAASALVHSLIAGAGMFTLVRVRGGSRWAAALGGVALAVGGYLVLQVRHIMFVEATAWMPWVVAAGWKVVEGRRPIHVAALAASTGLLLLTGGVSMIYYGAWFAAAVLLPQALAARVATQHKLRCIAALGIGAGVGLLVAAPSIVPAAAHGALSPRALGADEHFAASVAWSGLKYLPSLLLPNLLGQQVRGDYLGGGTQWEIAGYYTGMLTVALGLYALFAGARHRRAERISLGLLMAFCVLLAPGEHSPVHHLACRILPMYSTMRCPPRALFVVALAMPMLAADGLDRLVARLGRRPVLQRSIRWLAPLLVALDLLITHRAENPTMTLAAAHNEAFPDAVEFLRSHMKPGERYVNDVHLRHDLHNSGLLWDLPNASGYSSLPLWRYLHLLWISNHGRAYPHSKLHDDLAAQGLWRFDSPIVDLLGVRWVLAPRGWDPKASGYVKRFEGPSADAGKLEAAIDVWENTEALPRAWLVNPRSMLSTLRGHTEADAATLTDKRFDPWTQLIGYDADGNSLELGQGRDQSLHEPRLGPVPPIEVGLSAGEGALTMRTHADHETLLVIAEPTHPGWRATVDGVAASVEIADYALVMVPLRPGEHEVRLVMTARPVTLGLALGAAGLLCIAAMALLEARRRRREARV